MSECTKLVDIFSSNRLLVYQSLSRSPSDATQLACVLCVSSRKHLSRGRSVNSYRLTLTVISPASTTDQFPAICCNLFSTLAEVRLRPISPKAEGGEVKSTEVGSPRDARTNALDFKSSHTTLHNHWKLSCCCLGTVQRRTYRVEATMSRGDQPVSSTTSLGIECKNLSVDAEIGRARMARPTFGCMLFKRPSPQRRPERLVRASRGGGDVRVEASCRQG